ALRRLEDLLADAAEDPAAESGAAVIPHHDDRRGLLLDAIEDAGRRVPFLDERDELLAALRLRDLREAGFHPLLLAAEPAAQLGILRLDAAFGRDVEQLDLRAVGLREQQGMRQAGFGADRAVQRDDDPLHLSG